MKHGFLVPIACNSCTESAILETSLAYKAEIVGISDGCRTSFSVSHIDLESMYQYFDRSIEECLDLLCKIDVNGVPMYEVKTINIEGSIIYFVSVDDRWLDVRSSL